MAESTEQKINEIMCSIEAWGSEYAIVLRPKSYKTTANQEHNTISGEVKGL